MKSWKIWKTIRWSGDSPKSAAEYCKAFEVANCNCGLETKRLVAKLALDGGLEMQTLLLVKVSAAGLGINGTPRLKVVYQRARSLGLILCPGVVALRVRLRYASNRRHSELYVATEPLELDGCLVIPELLDDRDRRGLFYTDGDLDYFWPRHHQLIFRLPSKRRLPLPNIEQMVA